MLGDKKSMRDMNAIRHRRLVFAIGSAWILCAYTQAAARQVTSTSRLNLRGCPAVSCSVSRTLSTGTPLEVIEQNGEWIKVRTPQDGSLGWVNAQYTKEVDSNPPKAEGDSESIAIRNENGFTVVDDSAYFFSVTLPADWTIKQSRDSYSTWRVSAASSRRDLYVDFFAIKTHGDVDLEKLAANDHVLVGKTLGEVAGTKELKKAYFWTACIEKNYQKNYERLYARGRFYADGTYGYAVVAFSPTGNFSSAEPIFASFNSFPSFWTNIKNELSGNESKSSSEIVSDLVLAIMLFAVPVGCGLLGYASRRHSWLLVLMLLGCAAIAVALF